MKVGGGDFQQAFMVNVFCVCGQNILLSLYYLHIFMSHKDLTFRILFRIASILQIYYCICGPLYS